MKKPLSVLLLSVIAFIALIAFTNADEPLDALLAKLQKLNNDYPQEKIHVQFDKPLYSLGEDIWFKAYVVNAQQNTLSSQSKILYIDLLDDRDSVRKTLLIPIVHGMANGNIHLSDSVLNAGSYHIYAYTKWMINFGSEYFFKKNIPIVNALHGAVAANMQYRTTALANGKQLITEITYKTDNDKPLLNQAVNYTVVANGKNILTGNATTNADGKILISSLIKEEYKNAAININTTVTTSKSGNISQAFVIRPLAVIADVQFFPEGGRLISNIRTKVALKALTPDGIGETVKGFIADENNDHVAEFRSEHAGMGLFALQPLPGKTYTAVIVHQDGSEKRYSMPKADESGYVLNINHVGNDSLSVRIAASRSLVTGGEVVLIAHCNGNVQLVAKTKLDQALNTSYISTKKFPTGIIHFTLFTPDHIPVAERLVFVDHNDQLDAEISIDKPAFTKRGKVNLAIKVTDAVGQPVVGAFAVAVTNDKVKIIEDNETTILSNLLLTSDIKGYVEQPNYYFNEGNTDRLKHLDHLLLTQGWRRFSWTDLQANKYPTINYRPEQSLTLSGTVTTLFNKPVPKGKVTLFATTAGGPILIDTIADDNGRFVFNDLNFTDSTKLIVRATNAKDRRSVNISIDKKPLIKYRSILNTNDAAKGLYISDYLNYTRNRFEELSKFGLFNNTVILKEVKITGKTAYNADKIIPNSVNLSPGSADKVIKMEKIAQQSNLLYLFYGMAGIEIKYDKVYRVGRISSLRTGPQPMAVFIDGVQIEPALLKETPPETVAGIELLTSGYNTAIYGNQGAWGVILITTKRGGEGFVNTAPGNVKYYVPQGYTVSKQFYSPAYDAPSDKTKMADLRSTIYWNPDMVTDADGKASINYFNADDTGNYKVIVEGLDLKGKLLRKTYTYTVKN